MAPQGGGSAASQASGAQPLLPLSLALDGAIMGPRGQAGAVVLLQDRWGRRGRRQLLSSSTLAARPRLAAIT